MLEYEELNTQKRISCSFKFFVLNSKTEYQMIGDIYRHTVSLCRRIRSSLTTHRLPLQIVSSSIATTQPKTTKNNSTQVG